MAAFLERYLAGEHESVWADLLALGARVREDGVYTDALAVARETMRRARHNIEMLIPRLEAIGYRFGYEWLGKWERDFADHQPPIFALPKPDVQERIAELEALAGVLPLSLRAWYETIGAVNFVGTPPDAWNDPDSKGFSGAAFQAFGRGHPAASAEEVQGFEREHPEWIASIEQGLDWSLLDPLQVFSVEDHLEMVRYEREHRPEVNGGLVRVREGAAGDEEQQSTDRLQQEGKTFLLIAPDSYGKYNTSGSGAYEVAVPDPGADAQMVREWHHTTFVHYLRISFRWGGLPGLERARWVPARDLAYLTHDLLPL